MTYSISLDTCTTTGDKLRTIYLPHAPEDADKAVRIAESMQANGWIGRPVILWACGDYTRALTGTHRLCACINGDTEVEAVWIPEDLSEEHAELIDSANDDYDLLAALKEIAEERDMAALVEAMQAEIEAQE